VSLSLASKELKKSVPPMVSCEVGVTCGLTFQGLTFDALTSKLAEPALLHSAMTEHQLSHLQVYRLKIVVFQFKLSFRETQSYTPLSTGWWPPCLQQVRPASPIAGLKHTLLGSSHHGADNVLVVFRFGSRIHRCELRRYCRDITILPRWVGDLDALLELIEHLLQHPCEEIRELVQLALQRLDLRLALAHALRGIIGLRLEVSALRVCNEETTKETGCERRGD
jgi:hypothetical protein